MNKGNECFIVHKRPDCRFVASRDREVTEFDIILTRLKVIVYRRDSNLFPFRREEEVLAPRNLPFSKPPSNGKRFKKISKIPSENEGNRVYEYCRMVKIKEERERSTIDIGTRIYHSERVEVSRVVETSLDYTEDVYWNGANVRDSQSLPARRCDDHYDHGPRAMPTAVRDNETSAKAARSFCHLYPLRDRNIITPSLPLFLPFFPPRRPSRTDR